MLTLAMKIHEDLITCGVSDHTNYTFHANVGNENTWGLITCGESDHIYYAFPANVGNENTRGFDNMWSQ